METDGPPSADEPNSIEQKFDNFLYNDQTAIDALDQFNAIKCELKLDDAPHHQLFSKLKENFKSWRVTSFLEILQRRLNVKEYASSVDACRECNIFIIGAGPCGLRFAIEAALCGANAVVVEKRGHFTRNNVLHLWPYLIHDLRNLGIKKLFGKFCAGSLDHISIRRLQLILLKIALVLGVKVHINTSYIEYLEPCSSTGWRISVKPSNAEIEKTDFHVLVGADGKRNSIPGFQRKEFRAKLAIGITANFKNNNTDEEAKIEEISGVAALFNQKFFADLKTDTDIDLENIVYYRDDTHYFVMTAKKQCLIKKGVLKQDHNDVINLLSYQNVDNSQLRQFVCQAAEFIAGLPHYDFAINPDGKEDVAIFDFTSMYSAEYAAKIVERRGKKLIIGLVGDGLMEPFWPLGTGCARGFLSCMDLMWMIKQNQQGVAPVEQLQERMGLYKLLHQTSNENMNKKHSMYTLNPKTRYRLIPKYNEDVSHLYENDEKENKRDRSDKFGPDNVSPNKKRLAGETTETVHKQWKKSTFARTRRPKNPSVDNPVLQQQQKKKKRSLSPQRPASDQEMLLKWCSERLKPILPFLPVTDLDSCWRDGVLLCGLVHACAPKEIDMASVKSNTDKVNVDLAISVMFNEFGIQTLTAEDVLPPVGPDLLAIISTIMELKKVFEEIAAGVKHRKPKRPLAPHSTVHNEAPLSSVKKAKTTFNEQPAKTDPAPTKSPEPKAKPSVEPETPVPMEVEVSSPGSLKKRVHSQRKLRKKTESKFIAEVENVEVLTPSKAPKVHTPGKGSQKCHTCAQSVLVLKRLTVEGYVFHRKCFVCEECQTTLKTSTYHLITSADVNVPGRFFCKKHFNEIMGRSRDLTRTLSLSKEKVKEKEKAKPPSRSKDKKTRPQSSCLDTMKVKNKPFRPTTPVIAEDSHQTTPPTSQQSKGTQPTSQQGTRPSLDNPDSRYRDTALQIHRSNKRLPESPASPRQTPQTPKQMPHTPKQMPQTQKQMPQSPPKQTPAPPQRQAPPKQAPQPPDRIKSPKLTGRVTIVETTAPEKVHTRSASKRQAAEKVSKKLEYHEELPVEGLPDNFLPHSRSPRVSSPPIDLLPAEGLPSSVNVTVRKKTKSKKGHKAPEPPKRMESTRKPDVSEKGLKSSPVDKVAEKKNEKSKHKNVILDQGVGQTPAIISRAAAAAAAAMPPASTSKSRDVADSRTTMKEFAYVKKGSVEDTKPVSKPSIASGVKEAVAKDVKRSKTTVDDKAKPTTPIQRHTRAGSTTDKDSYILNHTKQMQHEYNNNNNEVKGAVTNEAKQSKVTTDHKPVTTQKHHMRASSMADVDSYIPRHRKQMQEQYDSNNSVNDNLNNNSNADEQGEPKPMSVRDRIAMYSLNDPVQSSASFSAPKKKLEVSSDLKKTVTRDSSRITSARSTVETDGSSLSPFARGTTPIRRKRLRLKPTNKQNQRRLAQAQTIQLDRSMLEQKLVEFENHAALIEQQLRNSGNDDTVLLSQFLELVNIKNELTRRENELHLCEKYLQLMDEQDQIERDLRYLLQMKDSEKTEGDTLEEEELILKKFDVVNRRDYLLTQLDENKRREEEENRQINEMLVSKGMSSKQHAYDTDSIITIESLLEPDDERAEEEVEDTLEMYEQTSAQVKRRPKKKRENADENVISRFLNRMSIFN